MAIILDSQTIRCINVFEKISGVDAIDCVIDGSTAYFVVEAGKIGLVIGKSGKNVKRIQDNMNKKIRVFEYSKDLTQFVKNLVPIPIESVKLIEREDERVVEISVERRKRSMLIGKNERNLSIIKRLLSRDFDVDNVVITS